MVLTTLVMYANPSRSQSCVGTQAWKTFQNECSGPPGFPLGPPLCGPTGVMKDSKVCDFTSNGFLSISEPNYQNGQYQFDCIKKSCEDDPNCGGYTYNGQVRFHSVEASAPVNCSTKMIISDCRAPYCTWHENEGTCSSHPDFRSCTISSECSCTLKSNEALTSCESEEARLIGGICYCPTQEEPEVLVLEPKPTLDITTEGKYECIAGTWSVTYDKFICADVLPTTTEISISATGEFRIFGTRGGQIENDIGINLGNTEKLHPDAFRYEFNHSLGTISGSFGVTSDTYVMRGEVHEVSGNVCQGATFTMSRITKLVDKCKIDPKCPKEAPIATAWGRQCISFESNIARSCEGVETCGSYEAPSEDYFELIGNGKCRDNSDSVGGINKPIDHYSLSFNDYEMSDCARSCRKLLKNCVGYEWFDNGNEKTCSLLVPSSKNRTKISPPGPWHYHYGFGGEIPTSVEEKVNYKCFQSLSSRPAPYVMTATTEHCCTGEIPESETMDPPEDFESCKLQCLDSATCVGVTLANSACVLHDNKLKLRFHSSKCQKCSIKQGTIYFDSENCCVTSFTIRTDVETAAGCQTTCINEYKCNAFYFEEPNKCFLYEDTLANLEDTCENTCLVKRSNTYQHSPATSNKQCSTSTVVATKELCETAASRMNIEFTFSDTKLEKEYPRGCWLDYSNGELHYNSYSGPSVRDVSCPAADGNCRSICLNARQPTKLYEDEHSCYSTSKGDLNLGPVYLPEINTRHMTVEDCYLLCGGTKFFGIKYTTEGEKSCWCSDTMEAPSSLEQSACTDICGSTYPSSVTVDTSCIYKTSTSGCFIHTPRKRCDPASGANILRTMPSITWVKQCEAACILDQKCTHFNWIASDSVKCVLMQSCVRVGDPESSVFEKRTCETNMETVSSMSSQSLLYALENNQGGRCNEPPLNPDAQINYGFCDFHVKLPSRSCLRPEVEQDGISAAFEYDDTCVCSISGGISLGDCHTDGFCHKEINDQQTVDISTEQIVIEQTNNGIVSVVTVGTFVGKGLCLNNRGEKYHYVKKTIVEEDSLWKGDEYYFSLCQGWAITLAAQHCYVVGVGFRSSDSSGEVRPICSLAFTRIDAEVRSVFEADGWIVDDVENIDQVYTGLPKKTDSNPNWVCFMYVAGPCSIADGCSGCLKSQCEYNIISERCELDGKGDLCKPTACGDQPQPKFVDVCHAAQIDRFNLVVDPKSQWPTPEQRTMTYLKDDGDQQVVWDYFRLTDKPSCEEAGYINFDDQWNCTRGLCATSDIAWQSDKIPDATEDIGTDRDSSIPNGCSVRCNFVNNFCEVETARLLVPDPKVSRPNCIESAKRGFHCICLRKRGPQSLPNQACTVQNVEVNYHKQEYGLGCGFRDIGVVKSFLLADISNEQECRDAACYHDNLLLSNAKIENLGNQPIYDDSTYRSLYSGTREAEFPMRWTGGCSIKNSSLFYVPPIKCEMFNQETTCKTDHGCTWTDEKCSPVRAGSNLCTKAVPCFCKELTINQISRSPLTLNFFLSREENHPFTENDFTGRGLLKNLEDTFTGDDELFDLRQFVRDIDLVIKSAYFVSSEEDDSGAAAIISEETREITGFMESTVEQRKLISISIIINVPTKEISTYKSRYDESLLKIFPTTLVPGWKDYFSRQPLKVELKMSLLDPNQFLANLIASEITSGQLSDIFIETNYISYSDITVDSVCFADDANCFIVEATGDKNIRVSSTPDVDALQNSQFLYIKMTVNVIKGLLSEKQIEYTSLLNDKETRPLTHWAIVEVKQPNSAEIPPVVHDVTFLPHLFVDTWGSGIVETCNPNVGSTDGTIQCGTVDSKQPDDEMVIDLVSGGVKSFVFNSYADPSREMIIKKHFIRGKAAMGVMVGGEPDMSGKNQVENGVNWYHCRTAKDAESGANVCKIKACGPFTVVLTAIDGDASVRLSLCYPRRPCACDANVAADGKVHSKCILAEPKKQIFSEAFGRNVEVPSVACQCNPNFTGPNCGTCVPGRFPQPGSNTSTGAEACSLQCANCGDERCGTYSEDEEQCNCEGNLRGKTCSGSCEQGKVGTYCNETHPVLEASFTKLFTTENNVFTPPPWRVSNNSKAVITIKTNNPQAVNVQLVAKNNLANSQQKEQELPDPASFIIDAAYYGPIPTKRSSYRDSTKLHILRGDGVFIYGVTDDNKYVFEGSSPIKTYYSSMNIQFCQGLFGTDWDQDYSSVIFLQDPGVSFSNSPQNIDITPGDWLVIFKGEKSCAATGSDRKFNKQFDSYKELFDARYDGDDTGFVHPWVPPEGGEWDAIAITGSEMDPEISFVKGNIMTVYNGLREFCCTGDICDCANFHASTVNELMADKFLSKRPLEDYTGGSLDTFFRLGAIAVDRLSKPGREVPSDGYPTVVFSEFFVYLQYPDKTVKKYPSGMVFSDMSLPASIYIKSKPVTDSVTGVAAAKAGTLTGENALKYSVVVKDEKGVELTLDNDVIYPGLKECGYPLTSAQVNAKKALEGAIPTDNQGNIDQFLKDQNDCNDPGFGGSLVGESSNGIAAGVGGKSVFNFDHLGINRAGRFKITFVHPKSGVTTSSDHIEVTDTDCDSPELWDNADQCRRLCNEHPNWVSGETTRTCTLSLSNNKNWLQLKVTTVGFVNAEISINLVQPCCNGRGICCAGSSDCTGHVTNNDVNNDFMSSDEHCTCIDDPIRGYWDQREDSRCTKCKTGYSGDSCTVFDDKLRTTKTTPRIDQKPGIAVIYAVPVSSETMFSVKLTNHDKDNSITDADINVGFQQCPGQEKVHSSAVLRKDQVALPCLGRGACIIGDDGNTACSCHAGYYNTTCDKECCSLKGRCKSNGSLCTCFDDDQKGHWAPAVSKCRGRSCTAIGGADRSEPDNTFCVYRGEPTSSDAYVDDNNFAYLNCESGVKTPENRATKILVQWNDLPVSTAHNLEHASIVFDENTVSYERGCKTNKIYIYATMTSDVIPPTNEENSLSNFPCDVAVLQDYGDVTCTTDSTLDENSAKCLCNSGYSCLLGTCKQLSPQQRCGKKISSTAECDAGWDWKSTTKDGDTCGCQSTQDISDELSGWMCENHVCLKQVLKMEYEWKSDINSTPTSDNTIPALQWQGNGVFNSRFFYEVASFDQTRAFEGTKREVIITDWLQKYTASLRTSTFSLSFAIVAVKGSDHCQIQTKTTPTLVMKTRGFRQPSRLLFGLENTALSERQNGQPFYNLYTADTSQSLSSDGRLNADKYRFIKRYEPDSPRAGESCGKKIVDGQEAGTSEDPSANCACPQDAMFQDPTDFVQIGEAMFFLATSDWEGQSQDNSEPCNPSYSEDTPIFQGAREIFFTKGLPKSKSSHLTEVPKSVTQFGSSQFPPLGGNLQPAEIREGLLGTRVYTRAKELTKMANPECPTLTSLLQDCLDDSQKLEREMLVYVTVNKGGDSVTVQREKSLQPTIFSDNIPQLWRTKIKTDGTPKEHEILAGNVMFPSYVTRIIGGEVTQPKFARPNYLLFLATENVQSNKNLDSYCPLGGSGEVSGGSQARGEGGLPASHATIVPKTLSVYWSDGTISNAKRLTVEVNLGNCQHQQGHPGFVFYKDYIYFLFDTDTDGVQLFRWLAGSAAEASPVTLSVDSGTVIMSMPPLSKGYSPLRVISGKSGAELLVLPLGIQLADPTMDSVNDPGGCFAEAPNCVSPIYTFQRSFKCIDPNRGITGLYSWNGDVDNNVLPKKISVGDPSSSSTKPEDPKWEMITSAGSMFWVGHDTGMTNMGASLSKNIDGVEYPAQQFKDHERQTLWYAERNPDFATDDDQPFKTPRPIRRFNYPVDMFGFKEWNHKLYFWAYDSDQLEAVYNDMTNVALTCYPPGRIQEVVSKEATVLTKVMSGINVPAYHGCKRVMYSISVTPADGEVPTKVHEGSPNDGAGVPKTQCCPNNFESDLPDSTAADRDISWPAGLKMSEVGGLQAGRSCKIGEDPDCIPNIPDFAENTDYLPKGCIQCYTKKDVTTTTNPDNPDGPPLDSDFVYPTHLWRDGSKYSIDSLWNTPHSGWWFSGFQSFWLDSRSSRASGQYVTSTGAAASKQGSSKYIEGHELYRPGGFSYREGWPEVFGVWEEVPDIIRNDCEDCMPGFFGKSCQLSCPVPTTSTCSELDEGACLLKVNDDGMKECYFNNGCLPKVCSGFPCSDGVYGNGTCLCADRGVTCESSKITQHVSTVSFDTLIYSSVRKPSTADCASGDSGCGDLEDEPCCGRSPEPLKVTDTDHAVFTFNDLYQVTDTGSVTLRLHSVPGASCSSSVLKVLQLSSALTSTSHTFDAVSASNTETLEEITITDTKSKILDVSLPVNNFIGRTDTTLMLTIEGDCFPMFTPLEFHEEWISECTVGCSYGFAPKGRLHSGSEYAAKLIFSQKQGSAESVNTASSVQSSVTTHAHHYNHPLHRGIATLVDETDDQPTYQQDDVVIIESSAGTDSVFEDEACTLIGTTPVEQCTKIVPLLAAYAYVKVTAFTRAFYTLSISYTRHGRFSPAALYGQCISNSDHGHWRGSFCLECESGYQGNQCLGLLPPFGDCNSANCDSTKGACMDDLKSGNVYKKCKCRADYYTESCDVKCTDCGDHGFCSQEGQCTCYENDERGYWKGSKCDTCIEGYYSSGCTERCTCVNGNCDPNSADGSCTTVGGKPACFNNFDKERCNVCKEFYFGLTCSDKCNADTCKGECDQDSGECSCTGNTYDPTRNCGVVCSAEICNNHGTCPNQNEAIADKFIYAPCICYQNDAQGYWDYKTNCTQCGDNWYGDNCNIECVSCSGSGRCVLNEALGEVECACFNDDERGHFEGSSCQRCIEGYTGTRCDTAFTSASEKKLGKAYDIFSERVSPKSASGLLHGAILHTNFIEINRADGPLMTDEKQTQILLSTAEQTKEVIFVACGTKSTGTNALPIDVWVKPYDHSVDFRTGSWMRNFWVQATSSNGAVRGQAVRGIFQDGRFFYYVVEDRNSPYIARTWAVFTDACPLCLIPDDSSVGIATNNIDTIEPEEHTSCTVAPGCGVNQQVYIISNDEAGIIKEVATGSQSGLWIVTEKNEPCTAGTCNSAFPNAHLYSHSLVAPLPSVGWYRKSSDPGVSTTRYTIVDWKFSRRFHIAVALFLEQNVDATTADLTRTNVAYHLHVIKTDTIANFTFSNIKSEKLATFDPKSSARADGFYLDESEEDPVVLIFGKNNKGRVLLQKIFVPQTGEERYRKVLDIAPQVCEITDCDRIEKLVPLKDVKNIGSEDRNSALLFIRTIQKTYVYQRINMLSIKEQQYKINFDHTECKTYTEEPSCKMNRCVWDVSGERCGRPRMGIEAGTQGRIGISAVAVDETLGVIYYSLGHENILSPSVLFKLDMLTLERTLSRTMSTGHLAGEVEGMLLWCFI